VATAEIGGTTGKPIDLRTLGLKTGAVLTLRCDAADAKSWLIGDVIGQDVRIDTWGSAINTPSRWRLRILPNDPTSFNLRAVGQGSAVGARYLALRPKTARSGPEPYLHPSATEQSAQWQLFYLYDSFGDVHFFGLRGRSWADRATGEQRWLKCDAPNGEAFATRALGNLNLVAWRFYVELPGY